LKILLDANLAVLLVLGSTDRRLVGSHKRIQGYSRRDFENLTTQLAQCDAIIFLPNTLTEVSDLIGLGLYGALREDVYAKFQRLISSCEELYIQSSTASSCDEFFRLGLTDAALLTVGGGDCVLLTDDDELYVAALASGRRVRNFRHIRAER
jgi:hypothetical protein